MKKETRQAQLIRDLAVFLLLLWAFSQAILMAFAAEESRNTYLLVLFAMDAATLVGFLGRTVACTALSGTLTSLWVAYKLYGFYAGGATFVLLDYLIIPLPLIGAAASALFARGMKSINTENAMLRRQVEELVLVDDVTGLYNLRALYRDLQIMVHYGQRNRLPISLMLVDMRYEAELRGMLSWRNYLELRRKLAQSVQDSVRVEDRVYAVSDRGMIAIILTTNERDSAVVRSRIGAAVSQPDAFAGILERGTRVELRFAVKQYADVYDGDMMKFKKKVESELAYDV